jgi:hypothetical protein
MKCLNLLSGSFEAATQASITLNPNSASCGWNELHSRLVREPITHTDMRLLTVRRGKTLQRLVLAGEQLKDPRDQSARLRLPDIVSRASLSSSMCSRRDEDDSEDCRIDVV